MLNIEWRVFEHEEQNELKRAIGARDKDAIACIVSNTNMDPEKEAELQKIVDSMVEDDEDFVSEVEDEVTRDFHEGTSITEHTPELEAKFQKKLDEEKEAFIEKKKSKKIKKEEVTVDKAETTKK